MKSISGIKTYQANIRVFIEEDNECVDTLNIDLDNYATPYELYHDILEQLEEKNVKVDEEQRLRLEITCSNYYN